MVRDLRSVFPSGTRMVWWKEIFRTREHPEYELTLLASGLSEDVVWEHSRSGMLMAKSLAEVREA